MARLFFRVGRSFKDKEPPAQITGMVRVRTGKEGTGWGFGWRRAPDRERERERLSGAPLRLTALGASNGLN